MFEFFGNMCSSIANVGNALPTNGLSANPSFSITRTDMVFWSPSNPVSANAFAQERLHTTSQIAEQRLWKTEAVERDPSEVDNTCS